MAKFVTLVIAAVLVLGMLVYAASDFTRANTAAAIADAHAREAEAYASMAQAEADASVKNMEALYNFASPLATGLLVLCAVIVGVAAVVLLALIFGGTGEVIRGGR